MKKLIALSGKMTCGKSTIASALVNKHHFRIISIGSSIKKTSTLLIEDRKQLLLFLQSVIGDRKIAKELFDELTNKFDNRFNNRNPVIKLARQLLESLKFIKPQWIKNQDGTYVKNNYYRELTQIVATTVRKRLGEDAWVLFTAKEAQDLANKGEKVICDDLRLPEEKDVLTKYGFSIIRINVTKDEQQNRLMKMYGQIKTEQINHYTETALDNADFDFIVDNSHTNLNETIDKIEYFLAS